MICSRFKTPKETHADDIHFSDILRIIILINEQKKKSILSQCYCFNLIIDVTKERTQDMQWMQYYIGFNILDIKCLCASLNKSFCLRCNAKSEAKKFHYLPASSANGTKFCIIIAFNAVHSLFFFFLSLIYDLKRVKFFSLIENGMCALNHSYYFMCDDDNDSDDFENVNGSVGLGNFQRA